MELTSAREAGTRRIPAILALLAVAVAGALATAMAIVNAQTQAREANRELASTAAGALTESLAGVATALSGVNGLAADGSVQAPEFQAFAADVVAASALQTLAHVELITQAQRAQLEQRLGRPVTERDAQGRFVPAAQRPIYAVVVDANPRNETTVSVLGFDIFSDPARARAAEIAARNGHFVLSDPVALAPSGRPGYFVIHPIFGPTGRPGQPIGFVSTGILAEDLVDQARTLLPPGTVVGLSEAGGTLGQITPQSQQVSVAVAGRQWTVFADGRGAADRTLPVVLAVVTLLLVIVLGAVAMRENHLRLLYSRRLIAESRRARHLAEVARQLSDARHLDAVVAVIDRTVPGLFEAKIADVGLILDGNSLSMLGDGGGRVDPTTLDRYRRMNVSARLPTTDAARTGQVVLVEDLADYPSDYPGMHDDAHANGLTSMAAVPLADERGKTFAVLALAWERRQRFGAVMTGHLETVAQMCGQAIDRARDADRQYAFVAALQRRLLPTPPTGPGLEIVARYRSATAAMGMGGDWYQFIPMPDGSLVVVVGDVIGHGVEAVAIMTQIQSVTDAVVRTGAPLSEVFTRVDTALGPARGAHASAILVHADPLAGRLRYFSAGHPYPLLRRTDGVVTQLNGAQHGLIGLPASPGDAAAADFPAGTVLMVYTDGLVERRDNTLTNTIDLLASRLADVDTADLDRAVDQLIEATVADAGASKVDDDLAVVLIRSVSA